MILLLACAATLGVAPGEATALPDASVTITACDDDPTPDPNPDSNTTYWFAPGVEPGRPTIAYFWLEAPETDTLSENGGWQTATALRWQEDGLMLPSYSTATGCYVYQW